MKRVRIAAQRRTPLGADWDVEVLVEGTRIGGHSLVLDDTGDTLLLVPPGDPHASAAEMRRVLGLITARNAKPEDCVALGRHLFDALIGADAWDEALKMVPDLQIVLELAWAPNDGVLNGLPWETMHDGTAFLALDKRREIVILRVVTGTTAKPLPIAGVPRVLFAIGSSFKDPVIRPGAEIIGIVREFDREGGQIASYVIEGVNITSLETAVARFRPNAVHLIGHGGTAAAGERGVQLRPVGGTADSKAVTITGAQLAQALTVTDKDTGTAVLPNLVVLSSCDGTTVSSAYGTPLAADLVSRGVPVVIAMAGRVTDNAARLFTRGFARSVFTAGDQLALAAAKGRRVAYLSDVSLQSGIDWALPTVVVSDVPESGFTSMPGGEERERFHTLLQHLALLEPVNQTVFFGRREFFRALDDLLDGRQRTLVAYNEDSLEGLGARRLLRELARTALVRGFVPIFPQQSGDNSTTIGGVMVGIEKAMLLRRSNLARPLAEGKPVRLLAAVGKPATLQPAADPHDVSYAPLVTLLTEVEPILDGIGQDLALLAQELAADMRTFARDCADWLPGKPASARVILFLPGLHLLSHRLQEFFEAMIGTNQLEAGGELIPIVATAQIDSLMEQVRSDNPKFVVFEPLLPFDVAKEEDLFAFSWVAMNPRPNYPPSNDRSDDAWGFTRPDDATVAKMRKWLRPKPQVFDELLYAHLVSEFGFHSFNDEDTLRNHLEWQTGP